MGVGGIDGRVRLSIGLSGGVGESPQYGHRIALDRGVRGDDEHIVGDGLGDDDAVEWVPVNVGELEDAEGGTFVDRQGVDPVPLPVKGDVPVWRIG